MKAGKSKRKHARSATAASNVSIAIGKKRWLIIAGLLLIGGLIFWMSRRPDEPVMPADPISVYRSQPPPEIAQTDIDPEVVDTIEAASRKVRQQPQSASAWSELGMRFFANGFTTQAATCFEQATALNPSSAHWPYLWARTRLKNDPAGAVPILEYAVKRCGNEPPAVRLTLIETFLELYRLDDAASHLQDLLKAKPNNYRARLAKARLLFLRDQYHDCRLLLTDLIGDMKRQEELADRTKPHQLLLAECLRRMGEIEAAESRRELAEQEREPNWPDPMSSQVAKRKTGLKTYLVTADLMYGRGQHDESIKLLRRTVAKYPDSLWAKIQLARALIRTGAPDSRRPDRRQRLQLAEELLRDALRVDPNSVEAKFRLGVALYYQDRPDEAAAMYHDAIELKPDFTMAHYNLAHYYFSQNKHERAIDALREAVETEPDFVTGRHMMAHLLMKQNRYAEAEEQLVAALKLKPQDANLRKLLRQTRQMRDVME